MRFRTKERIKRVIPLILALSMVLGVVASAVGMLSVAAWDDTKEIKITVSGSLNAQKGTQTVPITIKHNDSKNEITINEITIKSVDGVENSNIFDIDFASFKDQKIGETGETRKVSITNNDILTRANYILTLKVELTDALNKTFDKDVNMEIEVNKTEIFLGNKLSVIQSSIPAYAYNDDFERFTFRLKNTSSSKNPILLNRIESVSTSSSSFTVLENDIGYIDENDKKIYEINTTEIPVDKFIDVRLPIKIDENIKEGMYWVDITFICNGDESNKEQIRVYFEITKEKRETTEKPEETDKPEVVFNESMHIFVPDDTVKNTKTGEIIDFTVLVDYDNDEINQQLTNITVTSEGFDVIDGMETRNFYRTNDVFQGKVSQYYEQAFCYKLQAKEDLKTGRYAVTVDVKGVDMNGKDVSASNKYSIFVEGEEDEEEDEKKDKTSSATPFIIIEEYDYGGGNVVAGSAFDLHFTFYNTSSQIALENILVTITPPEDLSLTSSSNTFFLSRLAPQERQSKTIQVTAKAAAKPSSPSVNIKFKYEYIDPSRGVGEDRRVMDKSSEENIAIPLIQRDRFEVGDLDIPTMIYVGDEQSVSVEFINKGTTEVSNISAEISGNLANPGQSQYIGNLAPGEQNSADFYLSALEPGQLKGEVKITYEDSNGETKEVVKSYGIEAMQMEMPPMDDIGVMGGMEIEEPGFQMPFWGWVGIVVGGIVVVTVVVVIVVKKRRAKKLEAENEDL